MFGPSSSSSSTKDTDEKKEEAPGTPATPVTLNEEQRIAYLAAEVTNTTLIENALMTGHHIDVCLVRGGDRDGCLQALNTASAGGEPANEECGAPTLQQVISQVGGSQQGAPQEKLPEFTSVAQNSAAWARRGGWFLIKINTRYLAAGDGGQKGWICLKTAPLLRAKFIPHPNPIILTGGARALPNAD